MQITLRPEVEKKVREESRRSGRYPVFIVNKVLEEVVFKESGPLVVDKGVAIERDAKGRKL